MSRPLSLPDTSPADRGHPGGADGVWRTSENDRLIAVASVSRTHEEIVSLEMLSDNLLQEIEHFFISYNEIKGKEFTPTGRSGPEEAARLIEEGQQKQQEHAGKRAASESQQER